MKIRLAKKIMKQGYAGAILPKDSYWRKQWKVSKDDHRITKAISLTSKKKHHD